MVGDYAEAAAQRLPSAPAVTTAEIGEFFDPVDPRVGQSGQEATRTPCRGLSHLARSSLPSAAAIPRRSSCRGPPVTHRQRDLRSPTYGRRVLELDAPFDDYTAKSHVCALRPVFKSLTPSSLLHIRHPCPREPKGTLCEADPTAELAFDAHVSVLQVAKASG